MTDLDNLAWRRWYAPQGSTPLGYTPRYCVDCGRELLHTSSRLHRNIDRFNPVTGEENTATYAEHVLACPNCREETKYRATEETP